MSPLETIIRQIIAAEGPIPVDRYMALCLGHPDHGYYMARETIGAAGDFTTAPEVSQMFGEIVGAFLAHGWELLGRPAPVRLVELGPGRGTLMRDILRTLRVLPALHGALEAHLVEISPRLARAQAYRLKDAGVPMHWHRSLDEVPDGAMLLVANEFLDALPIRQLIRCDDGWRERVIGIDDTGTLAFQMGAPIIEADLPMPPPSAGEGEIVELCPAAIEISAAIGRRVTAAPGLAAIIDYGYRRPAVGESLQAIRGKRPADPLLAPGEADLTAHVDFAAVAHAATATGALVHGPVAQGAFLTALGLGLRAERLRARGASTGDLALAIERLAGAGGMGELFKVLAIASPGLTPLPPFDIGPGAAASSVP